MPSAMMHLNTALAYRPNADPLFLIGNLAPDCLDIRELKDRTHFRNSKDRRGDLRRLRDNTDRSDDLELGILLHLFLDYKWDHVTEYDYRDTFFPNGEFLFKYYRGQIHDISACLYYASPENEKMWDTLCSIPVKEYDTHPEFRGKDIKEYLRTNHEWNKKVTPKHSEVFSDEFVDNFINTSARQFHDFLENDILE